MGTNSAGRRGGHVPCAGQTGGVLGDREDGEGAREWECFSISRVMGLRGCEGKCSLSPPPSLRPLSHVPSPPITLADAVVVNSQQVGSESGRRRGLVLSLSQPDRKARGIVVRVAQYCQALLLVDGHIELERWEHCVDAQGSGDGWRRIAKVGSKVLPCPWTFEGGKAENAKVGDTLVNGDMEWKIEEKFRW